MSDALIVMTQKSFGVVGVTDDKGALAGIITDGDLRRHMSSDLINQLARDVMTEGCVTVQPSQIASEALAIMNERKITALFCIENSKPVGILHIHDCLRAGVA